MQPTFNCKSTAKFHQAYSQISVKFANANICQAYSGFSEVTPKCEQTVQYQVAARTCNCQTAHTSVISNTIRLGLQAYTCVFEVSSRMCAQMQAGRRECDDKLLQMLPLFNQAQLQLVDVMYPATVHTILQFSPNSSDNQPGCQLVRTVAWLAIEQSELE